MSVPYSYNLSEAKRKLRTNDYEQFGEILTLDKLIDELTLMFPWQPRILGYFSYREFDPRAMSEYVLILHYAMACLSIYSI